MGSWDPCGLKRVRWEWYRRMQWEGEGGEEKNGEVRFLLSSKVQEVGFAIKAG